MGTLHALVESITLEDIEQFMEMLTGGRLPNGMGMPHQPRLEARQAFSIVWYLQNHLRILPDHFEQCDVCERVFDCHHGGGSIDGTDVPDEWQAKVGVTQAMLQEHDGKIFCSNECELRYWHNVLGNKEEQEESREAE